MSAAPHTTLSHEHPQHTIESVMDHFTYIAALVGIPVLAIGLVVWLVGRLPRTGGREPMASRRVLLVTVAVNSLAVVALVLTLAGPSSRGMRP